jgi:predicted glycoside hydrolase/deacetylase ChbG (UPF0249 family)
VSTRYLIVNADDFGCSPQVSEGICEAYQQGIVTDASLLVRSPWAQHALQLAQKAGFTVGIHLDFVTPYVADRGVDFGPHGELLKELFRREYEHQTGAPLSAEQLLHVRDEIRSQISDFIALAGRLPSHLDYHFGMHYMPEIMAVYLIVAEDYRIPVRWCCQYARHRSPYELSPDYICDQFKGVAQGGEALFLDLVSKPWTGIFEMMCHPGYYTPEGLVDPYNQEREYELNTLTNPWLKSELQKEGIELVNYDWLKKYSSQPIRGVKT